MVLYPKGLADVDRPLWDAAVAVLTTSYRTGRHEVAAAVRCTDGSIVTGLHLQGTAGRSSVCAEGVALGAVLVGQQDRHPGAPLDELVDTVLAVLHRPTPDGALLRIVAPCGVCRELLADHCPQAHGYVHLPDGTPSPVQLVEQSAPGIHGAPYLAAGRAQRVQVGELLPGSTRRAW